MQATVNDDGLSFMFTVTERRDIADALDRKATALLRQSRLRSSGGEHNKEYRAYLRMRAAESRAMADQFLAGEGYGL